MNKKIQEWFFFNDHREDHVRALDGLRGIAVLMVLLSHTSNNSIYFHDAIAFNGIGKGGVYLFYVLSAYLLDRQISSALINKSADLFFWKRYFIRRFLRIYPLFIASLVIFWLSSQAGIITTIVDAGDILNHILLLKGMGIFWSIPVEFKYYLLSPLILWVCHKFLKWDIRKIALLFIVLGVGTVVADKVLDFHKISTIKYLIVFLAGTFIAIYNILVRPPSWITRWSRAIGIFGFVALFFCLIMNPNYMGDWFGISNSNNGRKIMVIYSLLCGIMLFAALYDTGFFKRFLEIKVLRYIGVISFSIYLFHMPVIFFMRAGILQIPYWLSIWFFLGATILLSTITYLLIERPLSRIRISKRLQPAAEHL